MSEKSQIESDFLVAYINVVTKHPNPDQVFEAAKSTAEAWIQTDVSSEFDDFFSKEMNSVALRFG